MRCDLKLLALLLIVSFRVRTRQVGILSKSFQLFSHRPVSRFFSYFHNFVTRYFSNIRVTTYWIPGKLIGTAPKSLANWSGDHSTKTSPHLLYNDDVTSGNIFFLLKFKFLGPCYCCGDFWAQRLSLNRFIITVLYGNDFVNLRILIKRIFYVFLER